MKRKIQKIYDSKQFNQESVNDVKQSILSIQSLSLETKKSFNNLFSRLTPICIFYTSKYFESIDDFINLEKSSKKWRGNCERFKIIPIPSDNAIKEFFPNCFK